MKHKMKEVHDNGNRTNTWGRRLEEEGKVFGGVFMMWLGVSFLLKEMNYIRDSMWWPVFAAGFGVLLVLRGIMVYQNTSILDESKGHVFGGAFFIFLSLASYMNFDNWWPIILIGIGLSLILGRGR